MFCKYCGSEMEEDAVFCAACGKAVEADAEQTVKETLFVEEKMPLNQEQSIRYEQSNAVPPAAVQEKRMGGFAIFMIFVLIAALLVGGIGFVIWNFVHKATESYENGVATIEEFVDEDVESTTEEIDMSEVDIDATVDIESTVKGAIKKSTDDKWILTWADEQNIYAYDEMYEEVLIKDVKSAYLDTIALDESIVEAASKEKEISVVGYLYVQENSVYIDAYEILDASGKELEVDGFDSPDGYVIAASNSRLLTEADVSGMSLQEINYAKNEIYARYGRKFDSQELQNYFNGKSWYYPAINPSDFSDSILSEIEKKNAEFLSNKEFSMNPNGYQLDAN